MVKVDDKKKDSFCPYDVCLRFQNQGIWAGKDISKTKLHRERIIFKKNAEVLKITRYKIDYAEVLNYKT